jgi:hypothetical protein
MDNNKFMEKVLVFVDRNGTVVSKSSTPMSCSLEMKYKGDDLSITMSVFAHGMGNGSCKAEVVYQGETVYQASGSYTSGPYHVQVQKYVPGPWKELMGLSL